jgi:hypothetical protein
MADKQNGKMADYQAGMQKQKRFRKPPHPRISKPFKMFIKPNLAD